MTAKEEAELLMNDGIPFAQKMLSEYGEFYPFGRVLTTDGEIELLGATDGSGHPQSQVVIDLLVEAFQQGAKKNKYKAVALFFDVRVENPPASGRKVDAVQVGLEHRDGYCVDVFFPYTVKWGAVSFDTIFAQTRQGLVYNPK